ncbi:nitrilase-related carbon-nitrogen hydrolase [Haloechinothrix halophila]|uniref:nitrilase-related carbon-nitrogen hydrolase n=1 Tax=Haloechinothrix halophila TaxID=1069073 RepID=UPI0004295AE2|nr:nitrilase-related carbon-nitrogen hydrolase [Haloechinothrix halophila]
MSERTDRTSEDTKLRVRLLQTDPKLGDVDGNLAHLDSLVRSASGSDLVVAPELATHGYHLSQVPDAMPLRPDDERLLALGEHAPAVAAGFAEAFRHHTFNSAALLTGGDAWIQRKMYLPTYRGWEERKHFRPGGQLICRDLLGTRLAMLVCNDAWQPAIPWLAAHSGAEVLVVPANSAEAEVGVATQRAWEILLLHTAVVLQSFVIFVNRSGTENQRDFWGGSRVIDPSGEVIGQLGSEPGELDCVLNLKELRLLRRRWPLLQESRADVVARESGRLAAEEF